MIRIYCEAATAVLKETETLTAGMVNYPQVLLTFSDAWDGMGKVATCRAGADPSSAVDVEGIVTYALGSTFTVPSECLEDSGVELYIGVQGVNAQNEVVIPTIWVSAGTIMDGVTPDEAINTGTATPTLVEQMIGLAGEMESYAEDLDTNVIRTVIADDTYANRYGEVDVQLTDTGAGDNRTLTFTFANLKGNGIESLVFTNSGENKGRITVRLSDNNNPIVFDGIKEALEYISTYLDENVSAIVADYIELHPEYVTTIMDGAVSYNKLDGELQDAIDTIQDIGTIPTKTSDLLNDSNFPVDADYVHTDNNFSNALKTKLDGIEAGAQENTITGVKGNAESTYRTGNVNITPENVGAASASHTHSLPSLGLGYATCNTAESTTAKEATLSGYSLVEGAMPTIKFTYAVPASSKLNINSTGSKSIYISYGGMLTAIPAGLIKAGDTVTFVYNGSQYLVQSIFSQVRAVNKFGNITSLSISEVTS